MMLYTKEDIIFESTYYADLDKLNVVTDMLLENYNEMMESDNPEVVMEAEEGVVATVKKFIQTLIKKIGDFFTKIGKEFKYAAGSKRIEKVLGPELKSKLDYERKNGRTVQTCDLDELNKVCEEYKECYDKNLDRIVKEYEDLIKEIGGSDWFKLIRNVEKLNAWSDNISRELGIDKIDEHFQKAITPVEMSVDKIYDQALKYKNYDREVEVAYEKINEQFQRLSDAISEINAKYANESVADTVDFDSIIGALMMESEDTQADSASKRNEAISKVATLGRKLASGISNIGMKIMRVMQRFGQEVEKAVDKLVSAVHGVKSDSDEKKDE